jgi:hypothetical protein
LHVAATASVASRGVNGLACSEDPAYQRIREERELLIPGHPSGRVGLGPAAQVVVQRRSDWIRHVVCAREQRPWRIGQYAAVAQDVDHGGRRWRRVR